MQKICTLWAVINAALGKFKIALLKNVPNPAFFLYCSFFSQYDDKYSTNLTINDKSVDGVLGTQTQGGRMDGPDESTELWRHPMYDTFYIPVLLLRNIFVIIKVVFT